MKICSNCNIKKDDDSFNANEKHKQCKKCISEKMKQYRDVNKKKLAEKSRNYAKKNKDKKQKYDKEYRKFNKEKILKQRKQHYQNNKEKLIKRSIQYKSLRLKSDDIFKFKFNTRSLIKNSFKRASKKFCKNTKTENILGCSIEDFRNYIQFQFKKGMTFNNHGEWHLDHIIPLATAKTEEDVIKLNHYTNFQPLWAEDNLIKSDKIIEQQLRLI